MRVRWLIGVFAGAAVVALTLVVAFGVDRLLNYSDRYATEADNAVDLGAAVTRLQTANWELASAPSATTIATAERERAAAQAALDAVRRDQFDAADAQRLAGDVQRLIDGSADQLASAKAGAQVTGALQRTSFDDVLVRVDLLAHRLRAQAKQTARSVRRDIAALALFKAIFIVAILGWYAQRRRRWQSVEVAATERARFEAIVEHGTDMIVVTDDEGRVTYISPSIRGVLGYDRPDDPGVHVSKVWPEDAESVSGLAATALASGTAGPTDVRLLHADGTWRTMEMTVRDMTAVGTVGGLVWSSRDVTERRQLEADLERAAFEDALTHLANRALFLDRLGRAVARGRRHGGTAAVLLADLDGFKEVNDGFGHEVGDSVLVEVAARLSACVREGDTVARLGGDEFTVLLEDTDRDSVEAIARRVLDAGREPISVCGSDFRLGVSVGIATTDGGVLSAAELLRNADTAMYAAKNRGRGRFERFEPAMRERVREHVRLASELERALHESQLEVYYQPIHSLRTGRVEGAEALVRWHHPRRGLVPPSVFIPMAEQTGQIIALGRWVLAQACAQASIWQRESPSSFAKISVNVSGCQLADPGFVDDVQRILRDTGIDPTAVVLEITESVLMDDIERSCAQLGALKDLGVKLAVDDFGTGYSSLSQLRRFPVDVLKIDRTFVAALDDRAEGDVFVRTIVDLGATLRLGMIAEGVEEQAQADVLREMGCDAAQGFLFSRAVPADQFTGLLCAAV